MYIIYICVGAGGSEPWAWAVGVLLRELRAETDGPPQAKLIYICIYLYIHIDVDIDVDDIYIYMYTYIYIYIWVWAIEVLLRELREETDGPPQVCIYVYV